MRVTLSIIMVLLLPAMLLARTDPPAPTPPAQVTPPVKCVKKAATVARRPVAPQFQPARDNSDTDLTCAPGDYSCWYVMRAAQEPPQHDLGTQEEVSQ